VALGVLERLLAPYAAAISGLPTEYGNDPMSFESLMERAGTTSGISRGQRGPTGGGPGGGFVNALQDANSVRQITNIVNRRFPGLDTRQGHHDESPISRDFTFMAGESNKEQRMLGQLGRAFEKAFGINLAGGPYGGHLDHLHAEWLKRRWNPNRRGVLTEAIFDPMGSYFG
jgi:hypothetical protein